MVSIRGANNDTSSAEDQHHTGNFVRDEKSGDMCKIPKTTFLFVTIILVVTVGCETVPAPGNKASTATANSNNHPPQPEPTPPKPPPESVTLPVLDAFFAQPDFERDLKAKLQLTDDQISNLKTASRQETSKLREDQENDSTRRTAAAREDSYQRVRQILGEQKAQELMAFVNERWSGTSATTTTSPSVASSNIPVDSRLVVNIPAFRMDMFQDGKLIKSYRIGIGYPEFPLPTGVRKAETIIFNPTWTPPDEPWVEAPGSKVKVGERVEAGDKLNPLGPIKIPIGLPSLIHGGKAPAKLGGFASHGCVGLTTPQIEDFVKYLARLSGTELTDTQIGEYLKDKTDTKSVKLSSSIPVELRYDTIVVEDGQLHIYRDVYDRGTNTEENLRNVLQSYGVSLSQLSESEHEDIMNALEQMARDASGKPATGSGNIDAQTPKQKSKRAEQKTSSTDGKVTRTIRGDKVAVVQMNGLAGKGYPAPVDLDTGVAAKRVERKAPGRRR